MRPLPYPNTDYTNKICIVTGANVGLGKEAARHFCRLGAEKVILACRDMDKGRKAQADIEASTQRKHVIDVWELDLASFQSVIDFCERVDTQLARVDVVVENAGVAIGTYVEVDGGYESSIGINVVATFLMGLLLFPKLRKTAMRFNTEPRLVVVSSDAHMFVRKSLTAVTYSREGNPTISKILDADSLTGQVQGKEFRPNLRIIQRQTGHERGSLQYVKAVADMGRKRIRGQDAYGRCCHCQLCQSRLLQDQSFPSCSFPTQLYSQVYA